MFNFVHVRAEGSPKLRNLVVLVVAMIFHADNGKGSVANIWLRTRFLRGRRLLKIVGCASGSLWGLRKYWLLARGIHWRIEKNEDDDLSPLYRNPCCFSSHQSLDVAAT